MVGAGVVGIRTWMCTLGFVGVGGGVGGGLKTLLSEKRGRLETLLSDKRGCPRNVDV